MRRSRALTVSVVVVVLVAVAASVLSVRACREPVDISGGMERSDWLDAIKSYDVLWYMPHVVVATVLSDAGCSPLATALQWLKAGAHATTEHEVMTVAGGLAAARARVDRATTFDVRLCRFAANGFARPQQQTAAHLAGINCP